MSVPAEKTTSLSTLQRAASPDNLPPVQIGFGDSRGFDLMQRGAKLLSASTLVPKDYQNNLPNCVIALNMATRLGADPLLVMQNLYVVHGRPAWSAQFLIATMNKCGRFTAIRYRWSGTEGKDDWSCQAWAKELDTGEEITGPIISIALAKKEGWYGKSGSKWQTIPQLMLMYRAAAWLVRTHAPELSMGLQTAEEAGDIDDAGQDENGRFRVTQADLDNVIDVGSKQPESEKLLDEVEAAKLLREAGDVPTLKQAWSYINKEMAEVPIAVEALYRDRLEAMGEKK